MESGRRNRSLESGQRRSGKSGETKGVEEQRAREDDEVLTCGQSGQVVGEGGRAFEALAATPPISLQSGIFSALPFNN